MRWMALLYDDGSTMNKSLGPFIPLWAAPVGAIIYEHF